MGTRMRWDKQRHRGKQTDDGSRVTRLDRAADQIIRNGVAVSPPEPKKPAWRGGNHITTDPVTIPAADPRFVAYQGDKPPWED